MTQATRSRKPKPKKFRLWQILPEKGSGRLGGLLIKKPKLRKQDRRAKAVEMYLVAFFPRFTGIGRAAIWHTQAAHDLASSPETAIAKHMDCMAAEHTWDKARKAGWRLRRVKIIDMGDPTPSPRKRRART